MSKANVGGEVIEVDADGFPKTYADAAAPPDDGVFELTDDATTPNPETDVSKTATADPPAPAANGKAKPAKPPRKPMKVPGPTNDAANNPNLKPKGGAKGTRTQASVTGKFGPAEPKGETQDVPLKELVFDRRLQMRAATEDKATVEKYKQLYQDDPAALPAIKAIRIPETERETLGLTSRDVVWDGFQRGEARAQAGLKNIAVTIAPGTFALATRLALTANSTHGLPRTFADLRRSLARVLDDDDLKAEIIAEGHGKGGTTRALARSIGVSVGFVHTVLNQMGLMVRGDKIVKRPQKPDATTPAPAPEHAAAATRSESKEALKSRATAALIHDMVFAAAALQRRYLELLERADAQTLFKEIAAKHGIPVAEGNREGESKAVEFWPAVDSTFLALDELGQQHAKMHVNTPGG